MINEFLGSAGPDDAAIYKQMRASRAKRRRSFCKIKCLKRSVDVCFSRARGLMR